MTTLMIVVPRVMVRRARRRPVRLDAGLTVSCGRVSRFGVWLPRVVYFLLLILMVYLILNLAARTLAPMREFLK